tara:strand:- start:14759 stop:15997 length:1239 start_codon:yes stop_codon:yes gene_type:complete
MCGLVGTFGISNPKMVGVLTDLLQIDVIRGPDSTGVGIIGKKVYRTIKELGLPQELISSKMFQQHVVAENHTNYGYLGHNRMATMGAVNVDNAHPFLHAPIMLTHNGTLHSTYGIEIDKKQFPTDSETICYYIAHKGIDDLWMDMMGAAALAYYNGDDGSLNLVRNDKRPLCYAYTKGKHQVIYASEPWMIRGAAWRRMVDLEDDKVWQISPNTLHTFKRIKGGQVGAVIRQLKSWRATGKTNTLGMMDGDYLTIGEEYARNLKKRGKQVKDAVSARLRFGKDKNKLAIVKVPTLWEQEMARNKKKKTMTLAKDLDLTKATMYDLKTGEVSNVESYLKDYTPLALRGSYSPFSPGNQGISEEMFHSVYEMCYECNGELDYFTAQIIDELHAGCGTCTDAVAGFNQTTGAMLA